MVFKFDRGKFFARFRDAFGKMNQQTVDGLNFLLDQVERDDGWKSVRHLASFFGNIKRETETFQPIKEKRASKSRQPKLWATQEKYWKPIDGKQYFGRGYIQLTHKENYEKFGIAEDPETALIPLVAYRIAAIGMRTGRFTGFKLDDFINDFKTDYFNARRIVNGTDAAEEVALNSERFEAILRASLIAKESAPPVVVVAPPQTGGASVTERESGSPAPPVAPKPPSVTGEIKRPSPAEVAEIIRRYEETYRKPLRDNPGLFTRATKNMDRSVTTIAGYALILVGLACVVAILLGRITILEATGILAFITPFLTAVGLKAAQDAGATKEVLKVNVEPGEKPELNVQVNPEGK